jgi:hypothetical protein
MKVDQPFVVCDRVHELEQRLERWCFRAQPEQQPDELEQQRVRPFRLCPSSNSKLRQWSTGIGRPGLRRTKKHQTRSGSPCKRPGFLVVQ